jgi:hypothetical protein
MRRKGNKRLSLSLETVRNLQETELRQVVGGTQVWAADLGGDPVKPSVNWCNTTLGPAIPHER